MRLGSTIIALGCAVAASSGARASEFRTVSLVDPQMPVTMRDAPLLPMAPGARDTHLPLAAKVRLRSGPLAASSSQAPATLSVNRLRARGATAMVDFYPLDGQGFHLSAGGRLNTRRNFMAEGDTRGLFGAPRGFGGGLRGGGMRKFAPAATMGYTGAVTDHFSIGVEAGARMGRAFGGPRLPHVERAAAFDHRRTGMVPVANLLVDYRF